MRISTILLLVTFLSLKLNAQNINFKHDWDMKYLEHTIKFTSKKRTPISFSKNGEAQAQMVVGAAELDKSKNNDLNKITLEEIQGIRKELSIDEYLEDDYKAKDNIVYYFDKIDNVKVSVIKYRTNGVKGKQKTMPRSTR